MKQKITLEINNETGLEFEERGEYRLPREGEYFIADHKAKIERSIGDFERKHYFVLTPKIDHELEEAKKLIGKWVTIKEYRDEAFLVEKVYWKGSNIYISSERREEPIWACTPFPLPVWRCCEADKPKVSGKYFVRLKTPSDHDTNHRHTALFGGSVWYMADSEDREWLDEGEL